MNICYNNINDLNKKGEFFNNHSQSWFKELVFKFDDGLNSARASQCLTNVLSEQLDNQLIWHTILV